MKTLSLLIAASFLGIILAEAQTQVIRYPGTVSTQSAVIALKKDLLGNHPVSPSHAEKSPKPIQSLTTVPIDIIDLTGRWYYRQNNCVVAMFWDGKKWEAIVDPASQYDHCKIGETIAEFFPKENDQLHGRLKVRKRAHKYKWEEVNYKVKLNELKGKYSWDYWSK